MFAVSHQCTSHHTQTALSVFSLSLSVSLSLALYASLLLPQSQLDPRVNPATSPATFRPPHPTTSQKHILASRAHSCANPDPTESPTEIMYAWEFPQYVCVSNKLSFELNRLAKHRCASKRGKRSSWCVLSLCGITQCICFAANACGKIQCGINE